MTSVTHERKLEMVAAAGAIAGASMSAGVKFAVHYHVEAYAPLTVEEFIVKASQVGIGLDEATVYRLLLQAERGALRGALAYYYHRAAGRIRMPARIPITRLGDLCRKRGAALPDFSDKLKWVNEIDNLVVNVGLDDSLDKHLKGSGYTAAWYVLLTDGTPTVAAGDTMASHAGWTEVTAYDEAVRQTLTLGSVSGQSVDNSASKAVFTISSDSTTIGGCGVTTNSTKGGSTGTLYGAGAFTAGDKGLDDDDVLNVTVTCTAAAA